MSARPSPSFAELFTPKLITVLREGYGGRQFAQDAIAGLTVAIVALPLSMAIAIASGAKPETGLYTAIVGGFIISALGGSRFQIGGPAGAFIVLVAATIEKHGYQGFLLATIMAGVMLLAIGYLRLGAYIKYIPHPVTVGFTAGIAVIIFASQLRELFGLTMTAEPAALLPKLAALWAAAGTVNPVAVAVAACSLALILGLRAWRPRWPGLLLAVALGALAVYALDLRVETIGTRFGGVPGSLPAPAWPAVPASMFFEVLPAAAAIALLGGVESLLSAVVADGMTGRRHRSNCELVAQGYANIASALFGGLCATGTIARTATNVRANAFGPVSGMLHAVFLLAFMLLAAPLASYIPLATLAAVLAIVSWNMAEKAEFARLLRQDRGEAAVLLVTFLLTVFRDLTEGIAAGVTLGAIVFMHRMAEAVQVTDHSDLVPEDMPDDVGAARRPYEGAANEVVVYRISGPFFFGAASSVAQTLQRIGRSPKAFVLDFAAVPLVDATAAREIESLAHGLARSGVRVWVAGASAPVRRSLLTHGLTRKLVGYAADVDSARRRALSGEAGPAD
ncbi:MAG: SulP family inorganic anion transporter [Methylobacteriaceae bacterium]|nr:SulP family inorganic anion transporter [Methylobacteriaceae bacterium]